MVESSAGTPEAYISGLTEEGREAISVVRGVILDNLPGGYEEGMQHGVIGYYIPLGRYPNTYNKRPLSIASLGAQKNHMALHLMGVYSDPETRRWFEECFVQSGKKLDMGKSCVRFKKLDDLPLKVIGEAIYRVPPEKFIERYEAARTR